MNWQILKGHAVAISTSLWHPNGTKIVHNLKMHNLKADYNIYEHFTFLRWNKRRPINAFLKITCREEDILNEVLEKMH